MKNLFKNTLRSLKNNKISIIGLIVLVFFSLGIYCVMNNTTTNISNAYNNIAISGNLHDFVVNELYDIGNPSFKTNTNIVEQKISFDNDGKVLNRSYCFLPNTTNILTTELWTGPSQIDHNDGVNSYKNIYVPIPELKKSHDDTTNEIKYTRNYDIFLDAETSDGLYQIFAKSKSPHIWLKINISDTFKDNEIPYCFQVLENIINEPNEDNLKKIFEGNGKQDTGNIFNFDVSRFLELLNSKTNDIYNEMINNNKPVAKFIDNNYNGKINYKHFSALNVTTTNDNIYYKIIKSNPYDKVDKIVLLNDQNGHSGYNLFDIEDASVYNSEIVFHDLDGQPIPSGPLDQKYGKFQYLTSIPNSFNEIATTNICSREECKKWTNKLEKYIYSQIIQIRFKRMLSGNITNNKYYQQFSEIAQVNCNNKLDYYKQLFPEDFSEDKDKTSHLTEQYDGYYKNFIVSYNENINIAPNGTIVFNWTELGMVPHSCTISNWTTNFCVVNPQFLEANNRYVLNLDHVLEFKPFQYWYTKNFHHLPTLDKINKNILIKWFNSLNTNEIAFWINPRNAKCDENGNIQYYANINSNEDETIIINRDNWQGIDNKYLITCGGFNKIIIGCGITPDFVYPVVDFKRPTPNAKTECLIYCNSLAYEDTKLAFANSSVEEYLVGSFTNANKQQQQQIINEINEWIKHEKLMLWPNEMNCTFFANDKTNMITPTSFRVSYIPQLINNINIITVALCCFIALLSFVICMIIVKRFVEKNRINVGIMLANGIRKFKIALSLIPFVLIPSVIGGVAAYITGFFLQIQGIRLFQNYWTLKTSILSFSWLAMLICVIIPFILFIGVCFIATYWILKTKVTQLMKSGSEFKSNSFSRWVKKPFKYTNVLTRFRISIAFNSLPRLLVLAAASCLTMTSLIFSFASLNKLSESQNINATQSSYNFDLELTTPTSSGSTYSVIDFSKIGNIDEKNNEIGIGYSNAKEYVFNTNWNTKEDDTKNWYDPYSYPQLTKYYAWKEINSIENGGGLFSDDPYEYREILNKLGNLAIPNQGDSNGHTSDLFYLNNKILSKLTLDYNMGLGPLSSNPWQIALALMPASTRNTCNSSYQQIIDIVGKKVYEAKNKQDKYYYEYEYENEEDKKTKFIDNKFKECISKNIISNEQGNYHYQINPDNVKWGMLGAHQAFNECFMRLIKTIFTDIDLMQIEYPIAHGFVPINWSNDSTRKKDEFYTYIDASIDKVNYKKRQIKINGIVNNSNFINLLDEHGTKLNDLLWNETFLSLKEIDNKTIYPIIVNAYTAHKYNLKVGSTIDVTITNTVDRFERQIHPDKFLLDTSNKIKWKVIAVSAGTTNDGFYCPQEVANKLIGLPDGKSWNKTHKYMMWSRDNGQKEWSKKNIPMLVDIAGVEKDNIGKQYDQITIYDLDKDLSDKTKPWKITHENKSQPNLNPPIGFNGIYTQNNAGKPLTSGMYTYSYTGMYPGTSVYKSSSSINKMTDLLKMNNNLAIANLVTGVNEPNYYEACAKWLNLTSKKDEKDYDSQYTKICDEFIDLYLTKYFGDTTMVTSISSAIDVHASNAIYKNLISTFNLAESSIMSIVIPMTIVIVSIISNLIIDDSKKLAAMLKTLGYSDGKNTASIFALFIPAIFIGLIVAIPLTKFVITAYQSIIFNSANILVNVKYTWYHCLTAISGVATILGTSYIIGWFSLKKDRLIERVK